jgi:hypothetical protein
MGKTASKALGRAPHELFQRMVNIALVEPEFDGKVPSSLAGRFVHSERDAFLSGERNELRLK